MSSEDLLDSYSRREQVSTYWYNKSSDLRAAAGAVWASMYDVRSEKIVEELGLGKGFDMKIATFPVYMMLCGLALELIYKAINVAKGNKPDTNSHNLNTLALTSGLSIDKEQRGLLDILSESIIWAGRYPVPKKRENLKHLSKLQTKHLFDKVPFGKLHILKPNTALKWESFDRLWRDASEVYWQYHTGF